MRESPELATGSLGAGSTTSGACLVSAFEAVRNASVSERDAVIDAHCGGDQSLRAELVQLLTDYERTHPRSGRAGLQLREGRYELVEPLGQGGFGVVWLAHDHRLDRAVAIKLLHSADEGCDLALLEARAASAIVSDHVRRILDVDRCPAGELSYIVMEPCQEVRARAEGPAVPACSLAETPARSRRELLTWCRDVALGVHAAHQQGVFHGDLKPENVMILPVSRRAQVIDFGVAGRFLDGARMQDGRPVVIGTPAFMAPEQAVGLRGDLDPSLAEDHRVLVGLDVYAVGALLYAGLSGRPPYRARPGVMDAAADVVAQVRAGPPAPLRGPGRLRGLRFGVSHRIAQVLERAMHRDPAMRYPSCQALADDLSALSGGEATTLDGRGTRVRLWVGRRQHALALSLLGLTVLTSAAYASLLSERTVAYRARSESALSRASEVAERRRRERMESLSAQERERRAAAERRVVQERTAREAVEQSRAALAGQREEAERARARVEQTLDAERTRASQLSELLDAKPLVVTATPASATSASAMSGMRTASPSAGSAPRGVRARAAPRTSSAVLKRVVRALRRAAPGQVYETRNGRGLLTHVWFDGLSDLGLRQMVLAPSDRAWLDRILRNRRRRLVQVTHDDGRVHKDCRMDKVTGSRVVQQACARSKRAGQRPRGVPIRTVRAVRR